jgi:hypothetical protein
MKTPAYIALLVICLITPQAHGWGRLGHELVGDVAQRHLTPKTKAAVAELLGDRTLADVAFWADTIKGQRPETRSWHYANAEEGAEAYDLERDCPGERSCVVEQINLDLAVLRDPETTYAAKVETLMFLVHFVGDIHQPLHLGRASDRGGNSIRVEFNRKKTNLHSLWDSGLMNHTKLDRGKYLKGLMGLARKMEPDSLDPVDWATGSLKLAYSNAYAIPKDGKLGDEYYGRNISVVNQRLAIAGLRLAAVLNDLYDPTEPVDTQPE